MEEESLDYGDTPDDLELVEQSDSRIMGMEELDHGDKIMEESGLLETSDDKIESIMQELRHCDKDELADVEELSVKRHKSLMKKLRSFWPFDVSDDSSDLLSDIDNLEIQPSIDIMEQAIRETTELIKDKSEVGKKSISGKGSKSISEKGKKSIAEKGKKSIADKGKKSIFEKSKKSVSEKGEQEDSKSKKEDSKSKKGKKEKPEKKEKTKEAAKDKKEAAKPETGRKTISGEVDTSAADERKKRLKRKKAALARMQKACGAKKGYTIHIVNTDENDLDDLSLSHPEYLEIGRFRPKRGYDDLRLDRMMEICQSYTGMFRDCVHRCDYVIVLCDSDVLWGDVAKLVIMSAIMRIGFDVEIERGVLPEHNNLLFCKLHASDFVLAEYMERYDVKKYYRNTHIDLIGKQGVAPRLKDWFIHVLEREWVKLIRQRYIPPLRLSNRDRSYLSHLIISYQPFGDREGCYGLDRAKRYGIVLDSYALHDGPYFISNYTPALKFNARQILYMYWSSFMYVFKSPPFHVIYEYYGPRIALFFVFYEFYVIMLLVLIPISGSMVYLGKYKWSKYYEEPLKSYCQFNATIPYVCRACISCPARWRTDFCTAYKYVKRVIRFLNMSPIFTLWCLAFYFLWKRRQNYYKWLWELNPKQKISIVRPQYEVPYKHPKRSKKTGVYKDYTKKKYKVLQALLYFFTATIAFFSVILITILAHFFHVVLSGRHSFFGLQMREQKKWLQMRDYFSLAWILPFTFVILKLIEQLYQVIISKMARFENHKYVEEYNRAIMLENHAYSILFNTPLLFFSFWIKGSLFQHMEILDTERKFSLDIFFFTLHNITLPYFHNFVHYTCNMPNCIDESLMTFIFVLSLHVIWRVVGTAFKFYKVRKTDFDQLKFVFKGGTVPDWEREFTLPHFKDADLTKAMNVLLVEITLFMWFGNIAPYMCGLLFIVNLVLMRLWAFHLVKFCKRPILINCRSLGSFNKILMFTCFAAPVFNALVYGKVHSFPMHINDIQEGNWLKDEPYAKEEIPTIPFARCTSYARLTVTGKEIAKIERLTISQYVSWSIDHKTVYTMKNKKHWIKQPGPQLDHGVGNVNALAYSLRSYKVSLRHVIDIIKYTINISTHNSSSQYITWSIDHHDRYTIKNKQHWIKQTGPQLDHGVDNINALAYSLRSYKVSLRHVIDIIKYIHCFLVLVVIIIVFVPSKSQFVLKRMHAENEIKRYTLRTHYVLDDDPNPPIIDCEQIALERKKKKKKSSTKSQFKKTSDTKTSDTKKVADARKTSSAKKSPDMRKSDIRTRSDTMESPGIVKEPVIMEKPDILEKQEIIKKPDIIRKSNLRVNSDSMECSGANERSSIMRSPVKEASDTRVRFDTMERNERATEPISEAVERSVAMEISDQIDASAPLRAASSRSDIIGKSSDTMEKSDTFETSDLIKSSEPIRTFEPRYDMMERSDVMESSKSRTDAIKRSDTIETSDLIDASEPITLSEPIRASESRTDIMRRSDTMETSDTLKTSDLITSEPPRVFEPPWAYEPLRAYRPIKTSELVSSDNTETSSHGDTSDSRDASDEATTA